MKDYFDNFTHVTHILLIGFSFMFFGQIAHLILEINVKPQYFFNFSLWLTLFLFLLSLLLYKFRTMAHNLLVFAIFLIPFSMILNTIGNYIGSTLIDKDNTYNYQGLYINSLSEEDIAKQKSYIFQKNDPRFSEEYVKLDNADSVSDEPEIEQFIFWQTGYICGFDTKYVVENDVIESKDFKLKFGFFVTAEIIKKTIFSLIGVVWIPILFFIITKKKVPLSFANTRKEALDVQLSEIIPKLMIFVIVMISLYFLVVL